MNKHQKTEESIKANIELDSNKQQQEELNKDSQNVNKSGLEIVSIKSDENKQIITVNQPLNDPTDPNSKRDKRDFSYYKGGLSAHIFRRAMHVVLLFPIPILYYWCIEDFAKLLGTSVTPNKIITILVILRMIVEIIRIRRGSIMFCMREYERKQISAQAWSIIGVGVVFLLAYPRAFSTQSQMIFDTNNKNLKNACKAQIALPIIWSLAIADPLLGEFKRIGISLPIRTTIAITILTILYIITYLWCNTPWWLCLIMPTISVASEYPRLKIIDDNGMMLLVPLFFSVLLEPWFSHTCTDSTFYSNS